MKKFNPAFWFMILVFLIGLVATIYTVILIGSALFAPGNWFGYDKEQLELSYEDIHERLNNFERQGYQLDVQFHPNSGDNQFYMLLTDDEGEIIREADATLYISRPAILKGDEIQLESRAGGEYSSPVFKLDAGGTWIFQLKINIADSMHLREYVFSYDEHQGNFQLDENYSGDKKRLILDLQL